MNLHIFEEYKSSETKLVSIKDVLFYSKEELQNKTFMFVKHFKTDEQYFKIKINHLGGNDKNEVMVSLIDTSQEVLRTNEQAHNELMVMINATVSHELRNPLNSIVAMNLQKVMLYAKIKAIINNESLSQQEIKDQTKELFQQLEDGLSV